MSTDLPEPTLEDLRSAASALQSSLPASVHAGGLTLKSKLPFKVVVLREVIVHRMAALATSAVLLLDAKQPLSAAIIVRAALETTALLHGLSQALERFLATKDAAVLDGFLMKGLVGTRWKDAPVQATNVLTLVDRLEKEMPGFREVYDELCEYAHPNWSGLTGAFSNNKPEDNYEVLFGPSMRSDARATSISLLFISLHTFLHYYNGMIPDLKALNAHFEAVDDEA
jgi:hypothetical protein